MEIRPAIIPGCEGEYAQPLPRYFDGRTVPMITAADASNAQQSITPPLPSSNPIDATAIIIITLLSVVWLISLRLVMSARVKRTATTRRHTAARAALLCLAPLALTQCAGWSYAPSLTYTAADGSGYSAALAMTPPTIKASPRDK